MRKRLYREEPDHVNVSITLNNLGVLKRDQGLLAEAEQLFRDSLTMKTSNIRGSYKPP